MKKSIWSILAIMMVTVFSFSFASCSKDKDDDNNGKGTYTLSYQMEQGDLTSAEFNSLNGAMGRALEGNKFEDKTLDEVVAEVVQTENGFCVDDNFGAEGLVVIAMRVIRCVDVVFACV